MSQRKTYTLHEEDVERVSEYDAEHGYDSASKAVREIIRDHTRLRERCEELEREIESERARAEDLRRQLTAQNRRSGEVEEVVEYAREEKARRSDRDAREQRRRSVSILTRTWWRLAGEPPLETNEDGSAAGA